MRLFFASIERVTIINDGEYFHRICPTEQIVWTKSKTSDAMTSENDDDALSSVM
jgi:hypothetical protein